MKNYVAPGEKLPLTAPAGGVVSGQAYLIGTLVVVAEVTAAAGAAFTGLVRGVVTHAKAAGAWTEGAKLYFDNATGAKNFTTVSTGNTLVGVAAKAAASGDASGTLLLDGVTR
jgi:predicted RecA/RadA family phage recombinase